MPGALTIFNWGIFLILLHISLFITLLTWTLYFFLVNQANESFVVFVSVFFSALIGKYLLLLSLDLSSLKAHFSFISTLQTYGIKWIQSLELMTNIIFFHPPGSKWQGRQNQAQPMRLFFTDQTKVRY